MAWKCERTKGGMECVVGGAEKENGKGWRMKKCVWLELRKNPHGGIRFSSFLVCVKTYGSGYVDNRCYRLSMPAV